MLTVLFNFMFIVSYVSIIDEHLVLSKEIYSEASIEICYFDEGE